jgi:hypothetical protein
MHTNTLCRHGQILFQMVIPSEPILLWRTEPTGRNGGVSGAVRIIGAAQLVPVSDLEASVAFYTGTLDREVVIRSGASRFVTVHREGMMLGLQGDMPAEAVKVTGERMAVQVWVRGSDALWAELEERLRAPPSPSLTGCARSR